MSGFVETVYFNGMGDGMEQNKSFLSEKTIIVAEVGINHGGDVHIAEDMIRVAHEAGADYVKLQSFVTEKLLHPTVPYFNLMKKVELSFEDQAKLFEIAKKEGVKLFSSPFDEESLDFLASLDAPAYKIASMDCNNPAFVKKIAEKNKPMFIATGLSDYQEIGLLLDTILPINRSIFLMHCVSDYPAHPEDMNIRVMDALENDFCLPAGLSDHTIGIDMAKIAVTLGAKIVEKHFTLDKALQEKHKFSDHAISMDAKDLVELRGFVDTIGAILGDGEKSLSEGERQNIKNIRRGIYLKKDVKKGEIITEEHLIGLRPQHDLPILAIESLYGKKATEDLTADSELHESSLS